MGIWLTVHHTHTHTHTHKGWIGNAFFQNLVREKGGRLFHKRNPKQRFYNKLVVLTSTLLVFRRFVWDIQAKNVIRASAITGLYHFPYFHLQIYPWNKTPEALKTPRNRVHFKHLVITPIHKYFPRILWNSRVHFSVHKRLVSTLNQVHTGTYFLFRISFNSIFPSMPRSSKWSFFFKFSYWNCVYFSFSHVCTVQEQNKFLILNEAENRTIQQDSNSNHLMCGLQ